MSSQRGNAIRTRPQKHRNRTVFKNDRHDTNIRTKRINTIQIIKVCDKCKSILEWKIKYKKYKLLKTAKSCNKCLQRTVKMSYHTVCDSCSKMHQICPKCGIKVDASVPDAGQVDPEINGKLEMLQLSDEDEEYNQSNHPNSDEEAIF